MASLRRSYCQVLQDLSNEPPVEESDVDLVTAFQAGHISEAGHKLFLRHYKMVLKITLSLTNGRWFDDSCIHAGAVGIYEAAKRFDVSKGYTFLTYAVPWIRKYVMQEVCNDVLPAGGIVFGRDFKERLFRYIGHRMVGRTDEEISVLLKLPMREIERLSAAASIASRPLSLTSGEQNDNDPKEQIEVFVEPATESAEDTYVEAATTPSWYDGTQTEKEARDRAMADICIIVETMPEEVCEFICRTLGICGRQRMSEREMLSHYRIDRAAYVRKKRDAYYKLKIALYKGATV